MQALTGFPALAPWLLVAAGPLAGSFAGLLADRLPQGRPVLLARSRCAACGRALAARDLVPLLSFLALRGRCRRCGAPIPRATFAFELAGLGVALAAVLSRPEHAPLAAALGWALLVPAALDLRHWWLPRALSLALAAAGLALAAARGPAGLTAAAIGAALGWMLLALAAALYRLVRRRDGLGGGDPPFLGAAGAWVGWAGLPAVLLLACLGGLLHALVAARGRPAATARVPLGAHLALGWWLVFLLSGGPGQP